MIKKGKLNIISLGCSKNLVDSEKLLNQFALGGWDISYDSDEDAEVLLINTCSFIADAKEESVDTILKAAKAKKEGRYSKVMVFGCLPQRYKNELKKEFPEIDGFFGVDEPKEILENLDTPWRPEMLHQRHLTTPAHYAYLKISEGCNRRCAFCIIPSIRGPHKSQPVENLVREAQLLSNSGVKELILIAQDLTSYGRDLNLKSPLVTLVKKLEKIDGVRWIRLHYAYPAGFPDGLISLMADSEKVLPYLDIPFQHASDAILKAMKRGHTYAASLKLIDKLRSGIPEIALRTTLITGFPGESENDFSKLIRFVEDIEFERLGVFTYSEEEGTSAAKLIDNIPLRVKAERAASLMAIQEEISYKHNRSLVGNSVEAVIDRIEGDEAIGRTKYDSPEVDQEVIVRKPDNIAPGDFIKVRITEAGIFELYGQPEQV
jgi:ribosomal protein S12 methylthiotransferase